MKISIITTTYNSERTLRDTIESVLVQTHKDIDYWIIDGGSTDSTLSIIEEYAPEFGERLHYISEHDHGIYDAMNKGIKRAKGDIVGILNSDDYFTSDDVLETVNKAMTDSSIDAVYADIHFIRPDHPDKVVRYYSSAMFSPFWLRFGFMPAHPSFYVRRSVYERHGLFATDYQIAADYDLMVRLLWKERLRTKYIKKDFVTMRTGGMSTKNLRNRILINSEDVRACRKYGMYTNRIMICFKYLYKIFEFKL